MQITDFDRMRELSLRGSGPEYIPRRYCIARGHFSDDSVHTVIYDIEEGMGIIGFGDGVDIAYRAGPEFAFSPPAAQLRPLRRADARLQGSGREILTWGRSADWRAQRRCYVERDILCRPRPRPISWPRRFRLSMC